MGIDLARLKDKFDPAELEWRVQSSGRKKDKDKTPWATVLAYVTNRAIMDKLDEVCGPENWSNKFLPGPDGGVVCQISIQVEPGNWVTKEDGAENTVVEPVKGGLSGSMKRAAVQWGIGRYLYDLDVTFCEILNHKGGKFRIADKSNQIYGTFNPPELPEWALPKGYKKNKGRKVQQPTHQVDVEPDEEAPPARRRSNAVDRSSPSHPSQAPVDTNPQRQGLKIALYSAMKREEPCDDSGQPVWAVVSKTVQTIPGLPDLNPLAPSMDSWTIEQMQTLLGYYNSLEEGA